MYKGIIIEESLIHPDLLKKYQVINIDTTDGVDPWHVYVVMVPEENVERMPSEIIDNRWYAHFWKGHDVAVVFKDKLFRCSYDDKPSWRPVIDYGLSIGIPAKQLDFPID